LSSRGALADLLELNYMEFVSDGLGTCRRRGRRGLKESKKVIGGDQNSEMFKQEGKVCLNRIRRPQKELAFRIGVARHTLSGGSLQGREV